MNAQASPRPAVAAADLAPLAEAETAAAVALLAAAFRDNPLNLRVLAGRTPEARLRGNAAGLRGLLPAVRTHARVLVARAGGLAGVLIGIPPHAYPLPAPPLAGRLRAAFVQGFGAARRWREVYAALDALHPVEPHFYLGTLGVAPERQREGIGRALLRHWLAEVDAARGSAYLETDRADNVAFYRSEGFGVAREVTVQDVPVWLMWRPAVREEA